MQRSSSDHIQPSRCPGHTLSGHALITVLIVLTLSSAILTTTIHSTVTRYQSVERHATRLQADILAESVLHQVLLSGVDLTTLPNRDWSVDVPQHGQASVQFSVDSSIPESPQLHVVVILPVDGPVTHQIQIDRRHALGDSLPPLNRTSTSPD